MRGVNASRSLAGWIVDSLIESGVRFFCVCPGARNADVISALRERESAVTLFFHFEERSAAFFALGKSKALGQPVAVVTTSGTAAGELLPATMEAHHARIPLVLLTTDRPKRYRGTGAPQATDQAGLFGRFVEWSVDWDEADSKAAIPRWKMNQLPVHINLCLEDPLGDLRETSAPAAPLGSSLAQAERPLVIVGGLEPKERSLVKQFLLKSGLASYMEPLSGLREDPELSPQALWSLQGLQPDHVVRLGTVPTHSYWRDLDRKHVTLPVTQVASQGWSGLARPTRLLSWETLLAETRGRDFRAAGEELVSASRRVATRIEQALEQEPFSEPGWIRAVSQWVPRGGRVYLGNSLPIREWDLAAIREPREWELWGNRGLNGIDGQLSSFLGWAESGRSNWAILGDLTCLYDLAGPWALRGGRAEDLAFVVINNGGGKIFERMFEDPGFLNSHETGFESWARMWGMTYLRLDERTGARPPDAASQGPRLIEIVPDSRATQRFWEKASGR